MAKRFSMQMSNSNAVLRYVYLGVTYVAKVRVSVCSYTYGVTSTESHSREFRAFYPHRRALGEFNIVVDSIGYKEFRHFMNWLRGYADAVMTAQMSNQRGATLMEVQVPARDFHKYGILSKGIDDHDQVGSMTFSQTLTFMTIKDFNDSGTAITSVDNVSQFKLPQVDSDQTTAFYPVTSAKYKDKELYDDPITRPDHGGIPGGPIEWF